VVLFEVSSESERRLVEKILECLSLYACVCVCVCCLCALYMYDVNLAEVIFSRVSRDQLWSWHVFCAERLLRPT